MMENVMSICKLKSYKIYFRLKQRVWYHPDLSALIKIKDCNIILNFSMIYVITSYQKLNHRASISFLTSFKRIVILHELKIELIYYMFNCICVCIYCINNIFSITVHAIRPTSIILY